MAKEIDETMEEQSQETREDVQLVGEDENVHLKPLEEIITKVILHPHTKLLYTFCMFTSHQVILLQWSPQLN